MLCRDILKFRGGRLHELRRRKLSIRHRGNILCQLSRWRIWVFDGIDELLRMPSGNEIFIWFFRMPVVLSRILFSRLRVDVHGMHSRNVIISFFFSLPSMLPRILRYRFRVNVHGMLNGILSAWAWLCQLRTLHCGVVLCYYRVVCCHWPLLDW